MIASLAPTTEVLLDLLFTLVQDLAWNPDYLPRTARGLPVIEIEAPRLLAHAFLFEVDRILKERTKNCFVRWMDDINVGVKTADEAHRVLGDLNDVVKSRGLALNLGKTEVLNSKTVRHHFMVRENRRLDRFLQRAAVLKSESAKDKLGAKVYVELAEHLSECTARSKDKMTKRFLTLLSKLGSNVAVPLVVDLFFDSPEMRAPVVRYLAGLQFSSKTARAFRRLLKKAPSYDDVTRLLVMRGIVEHRVPKTPSGRRLVNTASACVAKPTSSFDACVQARWIRRCFKAEIPMANFVAA